MPTYEYRCPKGHTFELFHRMADPSPPECQICGASPVEKVLYPAAIHFKGSGFYSTDYGRGAKKRDSSADGGAPESKPAPDTKTTESAKAAET